MMAALYIGRGAAVTHKPGWALLGLTRIRKNEGRKKDIVWTSQDRRLANWAAGKNTANSFCMCSAQGIASRKFEANQHRIILCVCSVHPTPAAHLAYPVHGLKEAPGGKGGGGRDGACRSGKQAQRDVQ